MTKMIGGYFVSREKKKNRAKHNFDDHPHSLLPMDTTLLNEWKGDHDGSLEASIQRTPDNADDTVLATLLRVPPPPSSNKRQKRRQAGLAKIKPPGVGFVWYVRENKDTLVAINNATAAVMFKKVRPKLALNSETMDHETLGSVEVPVIPQSVWNLRQESLKVKEDTTQYWNAVGTSRHSTPMNSHSKNPARKDLKKLRSRSLHKAWSEFKQSQYCTSIQLNENAYQIFSQTCTRLERKKWDEQTAERKRKFVEEGGVATEFGKEEEVAKPEAVEKPKRKKRRR